MTPQEYRTKVWRLCGMILIALSGSSLLLWLRTITGNPIADGTLGIMLGLYICSQPAANAIDGLFFQRQTLRQLTAGWPGFGWLALNILALSIGWLLIAIGATRLAARTP